MGVYRCYVKFKNNLDLPSIVLATISTGYNNNIVLSGIWEHNDIAVQIKCDGARNTSVHSQRSHIIEAREFGSKTKIKV